MKTVLKLDTVDVTPRILSFLERRKLIKTLMPTPKVVNSSTKTGTVSTVYSSSPKFGGHKLICVGKRSIEIKMTYHPANEELIIANPGKYIFKPLILVIGLHKRKILEQKARKNDLKNNDFMALKLKYDDFKTSIFTMLYETAHCEVTVPGPGRHPVFFVTEPGKMKMNYLSMRNISIVLEGSQKKKRMN